MKHLRPLSDGSRHEKIVIHWQMLASGWYPSSLSKRWWMKELTQLHQSTNKLERQSYNRQHNPEHAVYRAHVIVVRNYRKILEQTKRHHWRDWLEKAEDLNIWAAHHLTTSQGSDRGKARIPALNYKVGDMEKTASTN
jgi:hypothetical protein